MEKMGPRMKKKRKTKTNIRISTWGEEEQAIEEVEVKVKEEVVKVMVEEIMATTTVTIEATDGGDIEKTARRYNLGRKTHPKNLLQAVKGARKRVEMAQAQWTGWAKYYVH